MANVTINDEHLIAIGETLRSKLGETKTAVVETQNPLPLVQKTASATGHDSLGSMASNSAITYTVHTIPGASSILIKCTCNINSSSCNLHAMEGKQSSFSYGTALWQSSYNIGSPQYKETTFSGTDTVTIKVYSKSAYYIEICGLDADGNEMPYWITTEEGEVANTFKPRDMAGAIDQLGYVEPVVLTGSATYALSGAIAESMVKNFPSLISTSNLTNTTNLLASSKITSLPFELNYSSTDSATVSNTFQNASNLEVVPKMNGARVGNGSFESLFYNCNNLNYIPEDLCDSWVLPSDGGQGTTIFYNCYSLRHIPSGFLNKLVKPVTGSYNTQYYNTFYNCYHLEEVLELGVNTATLTSNTFSGTFNKCSGLRRFTFAMNEDGTPKTANWKNQTIDLSTQVGYYQMAYTSYKRKDCLYNSGITEDKLIYNDATYAALKNDPDAWVCGYTTENPVYYSFYNHDSAVETINSLPDCSASGGTNTIKFKGTSGQKTDGGAINTLTDAEKAVATAKGWTVTIV